MNNINHLRYAVAVEKTGSISKAAEMLYVGQPQVSKAIRELENSVGTALFNRTSKGVIPTAKGAQFIAYAKNILSQVDEMESLFKPSVNRALSINAVLPRSFSYCPAVSDFAKKISGRISADIRIHEGDPDEAISAVYNGIAEIALVRFTHDSENYLYSLISEKKLVSETILESEPYIVIFSDHPLSGKSEISLRELSSMTEIIYGEISSPFGSPDRIKISADGICGLGLLSAFPSSYMLSSRLPGYLLSAFSLKQIKCSDQLPPFRDVLIRPDKKRTDPLEILLINAVRDIAAEMHI